MATKEIEEKKAAAIVKFEVAKQIRAILDEARKTYGPQAWDDEDMENEIYELVNG